MFFSPLSPYCTLNLRFWIFTLNKHNGPFYTSCHKHIFPPQAINVSVNPLYFMIPATVGCSYAFMLPVSTPPNSIAFASGHLMVKDMVRSSLALDVENITQNYSLCFPFLVPQVKTGFVMNILGILSVTLAMNTWGIAMFNLNTYPEWALPFNKSALVTNAHLSVAQSLNATL